MRGKVWLVVVGTRGRVLYMDVGLLLTARLRMSAAFIKAWNALYLDADDTLRSHMKNELNFE